VNGSKIVMTLIFMDQSLFSLVNKAFALSALRDLLTDHVLSTELNVYALIVLGFEFILTFQYFNFFQSIYP
jgi:hypothetical protein